MEYIPAKQILSRNRSTAWFGTDYTMNLYRGCCHGCIYCDSRSACYGIEDFGRVRAKENALALLRDELRRKVRPGIVGMGSMSDPYNPFEGELQLTRHALELLDAYGSVSYTHLGGFERRPLCTAVPRCLLIRRAVGQLFL